MSRTELDPLLELRFVPLEPGLFALAFGCMKRVPAAFMLDRARERGDVTSGTTIVETTSGTFGLGLAEVAAQQGLDFVMVTDPVVDAAYRRRLEGLGARVVVARVGPTDVSVQEKRLQLLQEERAKLRNSWWPQQYSNVDNSTAYGAVAAHVAESLSRIDYLVCPVGSGGSSAGLYRYLKPYNAGLRLVGVDTFGSVIFGLPGGPRALRGLGNSLIPPNVQHEFFDSVAWIRADEAFAATRLLHRQTTLFMGPTSGAAWWVGRWLARMNSGAVVVVVMPDSGHRYLGTVYDDAWLRGEGLTIDTPSAAPSLISDLKEVDGAKWSFFPWRHRSLRSVLGVA